MSDNSPQSNEELQQSEPAIESTHESTPQPAESNEPIFASSTSTDVPLDETPIAASDKPKPARKPRAKKPKAEAKQDESGSSEGTDAPKPVRKPRAKKPASAVDTPDQSGDEAPKKPRATRKKPAPKPAPASALDPQAEPVVAEPVVAEPVVAEPVVAEPVVAEPVVAEPVVAVESPQSAETTQETQPQASAEDNQPTHTPEEHDNTAELLAQLLEKLEDPANIAPRKVWPAAAAIGLIVGLITGVALTNIFHSVQNDNGSQGVQLANPLNQAAPLPSQNANQMTTGTTVPALLEMSGVSSQDSSVVDLPTNQVTLQYSSDGGTFTAQLKGSDGAPVGDPITCNGACNSRVTIPHAPGAFIVSVQATNSKWGVSAS